MYRLLLAAALLPAAASAQRAPEPDAEAVRTVSELRFSTSRLIVPVEGFGPGDVLGYVGNTGNARHTPPHLHFQVLRRSGRGRGRGTPVNPYGLFQQSELYREGVRG